MAGAPGFEPGNGGIKIRCLTTWLRPTRTRATLTAMAESRNGAPPSPERRPRPAPFPEGYGLSRFARANRCRPPAIAPQGATRATRVDWAALAGQVAAIPAIVVHERIPDDSHRYRHRRAAAQAARSATPPHGRRDPCARHGRGREGQERPSRHADGHGGCGDSAVEPLPQIRSRPAQMAGPRPLRAVGRARLDAALCAALSDRLSRHDLGRAEAL